MSVPVSKDIDPLQELARLLALSASVPDSGVPAKKSEPETTKKPEEHLQPKEPVEVAKGPEEGLKPQEPEKSPESDLKLEKETPKEETTATVREKMKKAFLKKKKLLEATNEKLGAKGKQILLNRKLILAAKRGELNGESGVIALIAKGADVEYIELDSVFNMIDLMDGNGGGLSCWFGNALMTAAAFGQLEVVRYLLNSVKVKIDAMNLYFFTALTFAALNSHKEVVAELLYQKANPNWVFCQEYEGSVLFPSNVTLLCRETNPNVEIIKILLKSNIPYDTDYPNYHDGDNTALGHILFNKAKMALKRQIVEVLIKSGANKFTMPSGMKQTEFCNKLKAIEKDYPRETFIELNDIVDHMLAKLGQPRKKLSRDLRTESSRDFEAEPSVSKSLVASLNAIALDEDETEALISKATKHLDSADDDVAASKERPSKLLTFMMKKRSSGSGSAESATLAKASASTPKASAAASTPKAPVPASASKPTVQRKSSESRRSLLASAGATATFQYGSMGDKNEKAIDSADWVDLSDKDDKGKSDKGLSALPPKAPAKSLASGKSSANAASQQRFF